jgi:hypothetical protein
MAQNSFPYLPHTLQLSHHPGTLAVSYVHIPRPFGHGRQKWRDYGYLDSEPIEPAMRFDGFFVWQD